MDLEPTTSGGGGGPLVGVEPDQLPAGLAEPAQQVEVEAVPAADIEDAGTRREVSADAQQAVGLEAAAHSVRARNRPFVEVERAVGVRVDGGQLAERWARSR
ncbi:MAG: hypothetical protein R2755_32975 [Acidimicrobiales bacterium]